MKKTRLTTFEKESNDFQWYKDKARETNSNFVTTEDDNLRLKVFFDLYNNIIDEEDYNEVCKPLNGAIGKIPGKIRNVDIFSRKIKATQGIVLKRKFKFRVIATNPEATTRKELEYFDRIKQYAFEESTKTIRAKLEEQYLTELNGKEPSNEEKAKIMENIEKEIASKSPDYVKMYMERKYQDPVEELTNDLLKYYIKYLGLEEKFNKGWKYAALSAKEMYAILIFNNEPYVININPLNIKEVIFTESRKIEEAERVVVEYPMTKNQIFSFFGEYLNEEQAKILEELSISGNVSDYAFWNNTSINNGIYKVTHYVFRDLTKTGFLKYYDENGEIQETIVNDEYETNEKLGDIELTWRWTPEYYEVWELPEEIFVGAGPVKGQIIDIYDIYNPKNCYVGAFYDDDNSEPTSLASRLFDFQVYYNKLIYKVDKLIESDKGKKFFMNINAIPNTNGLDLSKFQYFFETSPYVYYDPAEEGNVNADTAGKVIDMSLASQINTYIEAAEYIRQQAGASTGITDALEGQIAANEAVTNSQQNIMQSSLILEPYFFLHDNIQKQVLERLIEILKICFKSKPNNFKLSFILDDLSVKMLDVDVELFSNSTFGLFVENEKNIEELQNYIKTAAQTTLPTGLMKLSDLITIVKNDSIIEIEEKIKLSEAKAEEREQAKAKAMEEAQQKMMESQKEMEEIKHKNKMEEIRVKGEEDRKTGLLTGSLVGASYNPEQDKDNDGVNDFLEITKNIADGEIRKEELTLAKEEFKHKRDKENKELELKEKEINIKKNTKSK